jgi:hypothetical protein
MVTLAAEVNTNIICKEANAAYVKHTLYSKNLTLSITVEIHMNILDDMEIFSA